MKTEFDPIFEDAAKLVVCHRSARQSLIQRRLRLGYLRSLRIIDQLEKAGIIESGERISLPKKVIIKNAYELEQKLQEIGFYD